MVRKGTQTIRVFTWGLNGVGNLTVKLTQGGNIEKRIHRILSRRLRASKPESVKILTEKFFSESRRLVRDYELVFWRESDQEFLHINYRLVYDV